MATCETCRHWQPHIRDKGIMRGACNSGDARLPSPALDLHDYRPVLVTRADFGCVVHAPIAETGATPGQPAQAPKIH